MSLDTSGEEFVNLFASCEAISINSWFHGYFTDFGHIDCSSRILKGVALSIVQAYFILFLYADIFVCIFIYSDLFISIS